VNGGGTVHRCHFVRSELGNLYDVFAGGVLERIPAALPAVQRVRREKTDRRPFDEDLGFRVLASWGRPQHLYALWPGADG
jgi:hypothetical protein